MADRREVGQPIVHITGTNAVTINYNYGGGSEPCTRPSCIAAQVELAELKRTPTGCVPVHPESECEPHYEINNDDHQPAAKTVEAVDDSCRARTAEETTWLSESPDIRSLNVDSLIIESEPTSTNIFADNRNNDTNITQVKRLVHCPQRHATTQIQEEANSSITQVKQLQGQGQKRHITTQTELPKQDKSTQTNISDLEAEENQQNVFFSDSELFGDFLTKAERSNPDDADYEELPTNEGTVERLYRNESDDDYECYEYGGNIRLNKDERVCYESDDSDSDYEKCDDIYNNVDDDYLPLNYLTPVHDSSTDSHATPGDIGENTNLKHTHSSLSPGDTKFTSSSSRNGKSLGFFLATEMDLYSPAAINSNNNSDITDVSGLPPPLPRCNFRPPLRTNGSVKKAITFDRNQPSRSKSYRIPQEIYQGYVLKKKLEQLSHLFSDKQKNKTLVQLKQSTLEQTQKPPHEYLPKSCNEQQQNYVDVVKTTATTLSKSDMQRLVAGESSLI